MTTRFDTLAVHAGDAPDPATGSLEPPVVLSNAFAFADAAQASARFGDAAGEGIYSRWHNPTVRALETKVAALEGAEDAVALASGMGAVHAALAANLSAGAHVVAAASLYAETGKLLREYFRAFGVETSFVDATDLDALEAALRPETALVYVETPSNPVLAITDLAGVRSRTGSRVLIVDSTFGGPYHQLPLSLGADLVVHSATKSMAGHGDVLGGVVAGSAAGVDAVRRVGVRSVGGALAPLSATLIARGLRTLGLRMERASANAAELARRLEAHTGVKRVMYPGLASHPGHAVAARQMRRGFGALVAFEVSGGREGGARVYDALSLITRAVSLGDVRTLITHAASTTHSTWTAEQRAAAGIGDGLMRLSVGVEDVEDLWSDLEAGLAAQS